MCPKLLRGPSESEVEKHHSSSNFEREFKSIINMLILFCSVVVMVSIPHFSRPQIPFNKTTYHTIYIVGCFNFLHYNPALLKYRHRDS
jgi:hypothetical protein